jgi:hypothetical protein
MRCRARPRRPGKRVAQPCRPTRTWGGCRDPKRRRSDPHPNLFRGRGRGLRGRRDRPRRRDGAVPHPHQPGGRVADRGGRQPQRRGDRPLPRRGGKGMAPGHAVAPRPGRQRRVPSFHLEEQARREHLRPAARHRIRGPPRAGRSRRRLRGADGPRPHPPGAPRRGRRAGHEGHAGHVRGCRRRGEPRGHPAARGGSVRRHHHQPRRRAGPAGRDPRVRRRHLHRRLAPGPQARLRRTPGGQGRGPGLRRHRPERRRGLRRAPLPHRSGLRGARHPAARGRALLRRRQRHPGHHPLDQRGDGGQRQERRRGRPADGARQRDLLQPGVQLPGLHLHDGRAGRPTTRSASTSTTTTSPSAPTTPSRPTTPWATAASCGTGSPTASWA